ncbi:ATPase, T2SS/T4P/T4SS family [Haloparvum sp. AD34]
MATEDADSSETPELEGETAAGDADASDAPGEETGRFPDGGATVGEYTWDDYLREYGHESDADALYERFDAAPGSDRWGEEPGDGSAGLTAADWDRTDVDPEQFLGFHPTETAEVVGRAGSRAESFQEYFDSYVDPETTPVTKGEYLWEHYKHEYYYEDDGSRPRDSEGEIEPFDRSDALGFDADLKENTLAQAGQRGEELQEIVDDRTVDVNPELDEDEFFSDAAGNPTLVNRYDLEKAVPLEKKSHFREEERYWANKPYSFVVIFHSTKENEKKYYAIQPYMNEIEDELQEYLTGKLRTSIKYSDESIAGGDEDHRRSVIDDETYRLLERYDLYSRERTTGLGNALVDRFGIDPTEGMGKKLAETLGYEAPWEDQSGLDGIEARPEWAVLEEDPEELNEYQVEKLLYFLKRDFVGYERVDPVKYDINVEDISCDGYNSPVFVYHSDYEQIITNIYHGEEELDDFVVKLAQRSGKGISKRSPQVDCTLPDGSRAQLTLGREVSDHGTNYTIRQFKDVPFTPIDLINWNTFSLDEMAFLWLCIENHKSLIFAGGTASGKTTSLNAVSLFIPSNSKIVSIEDTREVELPQRNWIASVTRPSFTEGDKGDVDEFDLLEAALRQRPDYIVMGEIRGEEGRTAFQVMSTGHTTYTTFHADSVGEVLKRFTTEPINVSKTMFTALDLVSIQSSTRVQGKKVRRSKTITEINHYDAENDEINVQDVFQWQAETDEFLKMGDSSTLEEIKFDRGWDQETLDDEIFKRQVILAYLIDHGLNTYAQVAATFQAFINDPETILALMANDGLERSLEDLREMESVLINVDQEKEEMVPRPEPDAEGKKEAAEILEDAQDLFDKYRGEQPESVAKALLNLEPEQDVEAEPTEDRPALEELADEEPVPSEEPGEEGPSGADPTAGEEPVPPERDSIEASDETPELASGDDAPDEPAGDEGASAAESSGEAQSDESAEPGDTADSADAADSTTAADSAEASDSTPATDEGDVEDDANSPFTSPDEFGGDASTEADPIIGGDTEFDPVLDADEESDDAFDTPAESDPFEPADPDDASTSEPSDSEGDGPEPFTIGEPDEESGDTNADGAGEEAGDTGDTGDTGTTDEEPDIDEWGFGDVADEEE